MKHILHLLMAARRESGYFFWIFQFMTYAIDIINITPQNGL
jgi:hypothetical protein